MKNFNSAGEMIAEKLSAIYLSYGYTPYRMGKFEEYDLYSSNKDFLISDSVITFNDVDGKLMALKPDVTLSIIKNNRALSPSTRKLFYNENVYRVSKGSKRFKEIMQSGVECLGNIDSFLVGECLILAARSLKAISDDFVLDVSSLDILLKFVEKITDDKTIQNELIRCVSEKSTHSILRICRGEGLSEADAVLLCELMRSDGAAFEALETVKRLCAKVGAKEEADELEKALEIFEDSELKEHIRLDFSVVSHLGYYNGVIFKGFIEGIPGAVLSGGRYDKLMKKMHRRSKAVGFAVYLDMLERLGEKSSEYDVDILLVYGDEGAKAVENAATALRNSGESVIALKDDNTKLKYRRKAILTDKGVRFLDEDA